MSCATPFIILGTRSNPGEQAPLGAPTSGASVVLQPQLVGFGKNLEFQLIPWATTTAEEIPLLSLLISSANTILRYVHSKIRTGGVAFGKTGSHLCHKVHGNLGLVAFSSQSKLIPQVSGHGYNCRCHPVLLVASHQIKRSKGIVGHLVWQ